MPLAPPAAAADKRLTLPTDWAAGTQHRYRVSWERRVGRWGVPGEPPRAYNVDHAGEIAITVVRSSKAGLVLRWEPAFTVAAVPPEGDMNDRGLWLWHRELALPLELGFDPSAAGERLTLRNEAVVREDLAGDMRDVMRATIGRAETAQLEAECTQDPKGAGCTVFNPRPMNWRMATVALFECPGLDVDPKRAESWRTPHPNASIGDRVTTEHSQQVVGFDPGAPLLRIKTSRQPDAAQMRAYVASEMAKVDASPAIMEALGGLNARFEVDCTMDRRSGWPVKVELRAIATAEVYEGTETVRVERIEAARPAPPPKP